VNATSQSSVAISAVNAAISQNCQKKRMLKNPLRVLDSKEPEDQAIIEEAPHILDWLSEDSKKFFTGVLEYLDELEIPYILNPRLVRGLGLL
jgi:histidyl-tRNA synthetase